MMIRKKYGMDAKFDLVMNMDKGDIEIYLEKTVVEKVENPAIEITACRSIAKIRGRIRSRRRICRDH